jgi:hypothetical protein
MTGRMKFARAGVAARPTIALPVRNEGAAAQASTDTIRSAANLNAGETTLAAVASRAHGRSRIDRVARLRIHIAHEQCNEQRNEQQQLHANEKKKTNFAKKNKKKKKKKKKTDSHRIRFECRHIATPRSRRSRKQPPLVRPWHHKKQPRLHSHVIWFLFGLTTDPTPRSAAPARAPVRPPPT